MKTIIDTNGKGEIISNYSFDYDAGGKIKEEKGLNENLTVTNVEIIMTYGKGNRLLTYNGQEVTYDADSNMTYGPLNGKMVEFKYDARNRLIEAGTTTYQYDAENNRIGKTENGKQTTYIVDTTSSALSRVLVEKQGNTVRQYIYATGLIMHVEGGEYATYHYDNRGSTVAITNSQGKVTDTFTYGPYGEQCGRTGKTRTPFLYNGRYGVETDNNGLYYMRARYYNPNIKRFINQDVVQGSLEDARSLNRFAYTNGNPTNGIDPFGTDVIWITSDGVPTVGHTSLIVQDKEGEWYYCYWGENAVFAGFMGVPVGDEDMKTIETFNSRYCESYISATYIPCESQGVLDYFKKLEDEYTNSVKRKTANAKSTYSTIYKNIDMFKEKGNMNFAYKLEQKMGDTIIKNDKYDVSNNNCTQVSMNALMNGKINGNLISKWIDTEISKTSLYYYSDLFRKTSVISEPFSGTQVPVENEDILRRIFANTAFSKQEFKEQISNQINSLGYPSMYKSAYERKVDSERLKSLLEQVKNSK